MISNLAKYDFCHGVTIDEKNKNGHISVMSNVCMVPCVYGLCLVSTYVTMASKEAPLVFFLSRANVW